MKLSEQNVLFISRSNQFGGAEKIIMQMCEILAPCVNKLVVCGGDGLPEDRLKKLGVRKYIIKDIESKAPMTIWSTFWYLSKIIKNEKITIVHTHHRMGAFYAQLLHRIFRFTLLATVHLTSSDKRILTRFVYSNTAIIACGKTVRDSLINYYGLAKSRVNVIYNSVNINYESMESDSRVLEIRSSGYRLIGSVGRLSHEKGVEYFIKSIPHVLKVNKKLKFIIVGDGEERDKLEELALNLGVRESVIFLGYRKDVLRVISMLDIVILSSLTEGFPLTPIEAFAFGKPVIATAVGGSVEIIKNNKNGFLVPKQDADAIADRIIRLINDEELFGTLSQGAFSSYKKYYSYEIFKNSIINYYKDIKM